MLFLFLNMLFPVTIKIQLPYSAEESVSKISEGRVRVSKNPVMYGVWKNPSVDREFYFKAKDSESFITWQAKCNLSSISESETRLNIKTKPTLGIIFFWVITMSVSIGAIYSISNANYDTPGFWPSLIAPITGLVLINSVWYIISRVQANKLKKDIIQELSK